MGGKKRILAVVSDLMFSVRILDAAKSLGAELDVATAKADALSLASKQPDLILLDLNNNAVDTLELIGELPPSRAKLLGFVSHVDSERIQAARAKGCEVIARSAFAKNVSGILKHAVG